MLNKQKQIPGGWKEIKVGEAFEFLRTYAFSRSNLTNQKLNRDSIGNIHYGDIHSTYKSTKISLEEQVIPIINNKDFAPGEEDLLKDGDIVMADASEDYDGIGIAISIHQTQKNKVVGGLHTYVLRDNLGVTSEYFRQYIFRNLHVRKELKKKATGVSVLGISKNNLFKIKLVLPPLSEQNSIVKVLETWDSYLEKLEEKIEIKKKIKKGLMQQLLTGRKRLKGFNRKWQEITLKEVTERVKRKNTENNQNILTISAQMGLINQLAFFNKKVSANNLQNYTLLHSDDFVYNKSYSKGYPMGAIKRLKFYNKGVVSSLYIAFVAKNNINLQFLDYCFDCGLYNNQIARFAQEGARNHGLLNIAINDFFNGHLNVPSGIKEQTAIANILTTADEEIEILNKQKEKIEDQKKYLLNNLITGKIRVPKNE